MKIYKLTVFIMLLMMMQSKAQEVQTKSIQVGYDKTTFIVFNSELDFYDVGSDDLLFEITNKPNIVKLKAAIENFKETNVTIITKEGEYFSLIISYNENPDILNYIFTKSGTPMLLTKEGEKEEKVQESIIKDFDYVESKIALETPINSLSTFEYKMGLAVTGIYVYKGNIYLSIAVTNKSSIDYNIDAFLFSTQQKRRKKVAETTQDLYMQPLHQKNVPSVFKANTDYSNILICFPSFTISNQHVLTTELIEKGGSRGLAVDVQSKNILSAKIIK